jgi:hypothetical protein
MGGARHWSFDDAARFLSEERGYAKGSGARERPGDNEYWESFCDNICKDGGGLDGKGRRRRGFSDDRIMHVTRERMKDLT